MLTQAQLSQFKAILLHERDEKLQELEQVRGPIREESMKESTEALSSYDNFSGDLAFVTFDRGKDLGLASNLEVILTQIDDALERIEEGTYGTCSVCGTEIPVDRLKALPYATTCIEHSDSEYENNLRLPANAEVLAPPFARSFTDNDEHDSVGFDGEDTWQAVAKWGDANSPQDVPDSIGYDEVYVNADENVGIVGEGDALIDVTEGEEDQDRIIFPDPQRNMDRQPYKKRLKGDRR